MNALFSYIKNGHTESLEITKADGNGMLFKKRVRRLLHSSTLPENYTLEFDDEEMHNA